MIKVPAAVLRVMHKPTGGMLDAIWRHAMPEALPIGCYLGKKLAAAEKKYLRRLRLQSDQAMRTWHATLAMREAAQQERTPSFMAAIELSWREYDRSWREWMHGYTARPEQVTMVRRHTA